MFIKVGRFFTRLRTFLRKFLELIHICEQKHNVNSNKTPSSLTVLELKPFAEDDVLKSYRKCKILKRKKKQFQ